VRVDINPYSILPATSIVIFVFFILYLTLRVRRTEARDFVILATSFVNAWALGEFMMRASNDEGIALIGSKVFLNTGIGLLGPTVLYMVMLVAEYVKPLKGISLFITIYMVPIWVIAVRAGTDWIQSGVTENYWGYSDALSGPLGPVYYIFSSSFLFAALVLLAKRYFNTVGNNRQIALLMFVGLLIPLSLTVSTDILLPAINIRIPELAVPACIIFIGALFVSLKKFDLFEIKPVTEKKVAVPEKGSPKETGLVTDLPSGKIYYLEESKPDLTFKVFTSLVSHGRQGLGIIRISPQKFREMTGLEKTPVIWLSSQENSTMKTLNPSSISRIYATVVEFLKSAERPVILLEGIEVLIFTNSFREVMGFLSSAFEKISLSDGVLILPISRPTMNETEWTLLTRHMEDLAKFKAGPEDAST